MFRNQKRQPHDVGRFSVRFTAVARHARPQGQSERHSCMRQRDVLHCCVPRPTQRSCALHQRIRIVGQPPVRCEMAASLAATAGHLHHDEAAAANRSAIWPSVTTPGRVACPLPGTRRRRFSDCGRRTSLGRSGLRIWGCSRACPMLASSEPRWNPFRSTSRALQIWIEMRVNQQAGTHQRPPLAPPPRGRDPRALPCTALCPRSSAPATVQSPARKHHPRAPPLHSP